MAEEAKKEKARVSKVHSQCARVIGRLLSTLVQVRQLLKDGNMSHLPAAMNTKMRQHLQTLEEYEKEAKIKQRCKDPLDLTFEIEDVAIACKEAAADEKVCQQMIQSFIKMS